ncbi:hypothetical protein HDU91_002749 [Kappamyces sp. JEL0680]|nr:hypothetical protein HDU91_002749 [Kappamyces sp. JEL0680]
MVRTGAESNVNQGKRKNLTRERRRSKQRSKLARGISARAVVDKTNEAIPDLLESVVKATAEKRQQLLLTDKAHDDPNIKKVKWVTGVRPARMGKHGIAIRPTRINKKKVKQMLKRQISAKQILEAVNANEVDME